MSAAFSAAASGSASNYPLDGIVDAQHQGRPAGITSICSAHPAVVEASLRHALAAGTPVLIESTCNQVNQFGGYTGMTPKDFVAFIRGLADQVGISMERVILGGDHLGPNVWQREPEAPAMAKSEAMVRAYIDAGYTKIHLDASMKLADDDPHTPLSKEVSARRAARLAQAAEQAHQNHPGQPAPRYIIGTEVPIPGGAVEAEETLTVTAVPDAAETIAVTHAAFLALGLEQAWERVRAVVVQPGVEFGDHAIHEYQSAAAADLACFIETHPGLVFEAHSTDYQTRKALRALVRDHFAILKVGPGLTFAFREAVFALAAIEAQIPPAKLPGAPSHLPAVLDQQMRAHPEHWQRYYPGTPDEQLFARRYSFSDRSRYYWPDPAIQAALIDLLNNLAAFPPPLPLLSQYLPREYTLVRAGLLPNTPQALLQSRIAAVLDDYAYACAG